MAQREKSLVARLLEGDESAFERIHSLHFRRIYGYMRVALGDLHEAEDATQEVFERLLGSLERCEEAGAPLEAWIATITRNLAINRLAKHGAICVGGAADVEAVSSQAVPSLERLMLVGASDREFLRTIAGLPETQRRVLVLRYMLDLGWDEIAELIGRSVGGAHQIQNRAFRALRPRLATLHAVAAADP